MQSKRAWKSGLEISWEQALSRAFQYFLLLVELEILKGWNPGPAEVNGNFAINFNGARISLLVFTPCIQSQLDLVWCEKENFAFFFSFLLQDLMLKKILCLQVRCKYWAMPKEFPCNPNEQFLLSEQWHSRNCGIKNIKLYKDSEIKAACMK